MSVNSHNAVRIGSAVLGIAALVAVGWYTFSAFDSGLSLTSLRLNWLLAAFAVHVLLIAALPVIWIRVLNMVRSDSDAKVRSRDVAVYSMYARSWLARYVPGRVWMFGGRVLYGRRVGISARAISSGSFLEAAISYSAIGILGFAFLLGAWVHWSLAIAVAVGGFAATWFVLRSAMSMAETAVSEGRVTSLISRISPWVTGDGRPSNRELSGVILVYWLHSLVQLLFFVLVALSVGDYSANEFMLLAGAWGVGASAGYISIFSAGGLGVRDGVALAFVGPALTGPVGATIVAVGRIILVLADLFIVGAVELTALAIKRKRNHSDRSSIVAPGKGAERA